MTAALYSLRAGKSVTIIEAESIGGQIANSPRVENFPGFSSISGLELADKMFEQVNALGAALEIDRVVGVEKHSEKHFTVKTEYGAYECGSVIIAGGVKHRRLNVPGEDKFLGKGVYYCAVCDGAFYKDKEVILVGDANSALQYALLLSNYCSKVSMVTMFDKLFGDNCLQQAVRSRENVEIISGFVASSVMGDGAFEGVEFVRTGGTEKMTLKAEALFVAIGQIPDNKAFTPLVTLDKSGFIECTDDCRTSASGVFAAGDCRVKSVRQLTTAVADGAVAALAAAAYLDGE